LRDLRGRLAGLLLGLALVGAALTPDLPADAEARRFVLDPARSRLRFHAVSRLMNADGHFGRFAGEVTLEPSRVETATGRVAVDVASIDTGITRRDNHLRSDDFFAAARHPEATLVIERVVPEGNRWLVSGPLTIRGVTRALAVPVSVTVGPDTVRIVGQFTLRRREFGIAYESVFNPIQDEVRVSFDLLATRAAAPA
jgi:polyisoprenoid-binding protein YceI